MRNMWHGCGTGCCPAFGRNVTMNELNLRRILIDGGLLNTLLAIQIVGSLRYNPEIWLQDYPPDVREAYGPKSDRARRQTWLFGIPFMLTLFGGTYLSTRRLRRENGDRLSFRAAFLHAYAVLLSFWLFDLLVIDWTLLGLLKPEFAILPGTEGMAGYDDKLFHLREALPALLGMALPSGLIALAAAGGPDR